MEYISIKESSMRSKSERRIQQMCKNNEIDGAIKKGGAWFVPINFLTLNEKC